MSAGKPWKPGQSGNPGGRKRGIEKMFQELIGKLEFDDRKGFEALIARLAKIAFTGADRDSVAAIKLMFERALGHPAQEVELTGDVTSTTAAPAVDWSRVPLELRRQLLAALKEPSLDRPAES